jgi:peptidoglycan/LPS O-acetylase OafA/YrhL
VARELAGAPLSARRFPAADGIRGLAILLVVLHNSEFIERNGTGVLVKLTGAIAATGWVGVQLFFVLSGFLITGILLDTLGSRDFFRNFYIRRTLRIFPLYYAVLIFALLLLPHLADVPEWTAVARENQWWYWSYLSNWGGVFRHSIPGFTHFWSLAVEEQFYVVWPVMVFTLSRRGLIGLCAIMVATTPLIRFGLHLAGLPPQAGYELTVARWDALAAGALLAVLMRNAALEEQLARWIAKITIVSLGGLVLLVLYERGLHFDDLVVQVAGQTLIAFLSASLVYYCVAPPTGPALRVQQLMSAAWLRFFGKYSYAMYVFHFPIQFILSFYLADSINTGEPNARFLKLMTYLAFVVVLSTLAAMASWRVLEKPFLDLKDRLAPRGVEQPA